MCHLRKFTYLCGHSDTIVISPCRQTTLKIKRSNTTSPAEKWLRMKEAGDLELRWKGSEQMLSYVPACRPGPSLCLAVKHVCGVCLFDQQMREWSTRIETMEAKVAEARVLWGADDGLLATLEQDLEHLTEQKGETEWRCRQQFPTTRHIRPSKSERLGIKITCGSPLRTESMWEDIQVNDEPELRAVDEQGIPFTTFWDFFSDRYLWMGPVVDWSEQSVDHDRHGNSMIGNHDEPYTHSTRAEHRGSDTEPLLDIGSNMEFLVLDQRLRSGGRCGQDGCAHK